MLKTNVSIFCGSVLFSVLSGCGSMNLQESSTLKAIPTIGLKSSWSVDRSRDGRRQMVYCPLNASLPEGFYASRLAGDCSILQGGQKSGVTALLAQEIRPQDRVLCIVKNSDLPSGWNYQKGPSGRVSCGASGVQIQKIQ